VANAPRGNTRRTNRSAHSTQRTKPGSRAVSSRVLECDDWARLSIRASRPRRRRLRRPVGYRVTINPDPATGYAPLVTSRARIEALLRPCSAARQSRVLSLTRTWSRRAVSLAEGCAATPSAALPPRSKHSQKWRPGAVSPRRNYAVERERRLIEGARHSGPRKARLLRSPRGSLPPALLESKLDPRRRCPQKKPRRERPGAGAAA